MGPSYGCVEEIPAPPSKYAPVPQWLEELIQQLLAKTPAERPQLAEEVAKAPTLGSAAGPEGPDHVPHRNVRRGDLGGKRSRNPDGVEV